MVGDFFGKYFQIFYYDSIGDQNVVSIFLRLGIETCSGRGNAKCLDKVLKTRVFELLKTLGIRSKIKVTTQ